MQHRLDTLLDDYDCYCDFPVFLVELISNVLTAILTKLIKASFAKVCAKGLQDKI